MTREELEQILVQTGFKDKIISMKGWNNSYLELNHRSFGMFEVYELSPTKQIELGVKYLIGAKRFSKNTANTHSKSSTKYLYCVKDADSFLECLRVEDIRVANEEEISLICKIRDEYYYEQRRKKRKLSLREMGQMYYEEHYGTREDFIREFGKSFL